MPTTIVIFDPDATGKRAIAVNGIFAIPAPNQPAVNPVDATGGFIGTPASPDALPFDLNTIYDDQATPEALITEFNKRGGTTFNVIRSMATGKARFQIFPAHPLSGGFGSGGVGSDWETVVVGVTGPAPAPNVPPGFNVWSQDQADNQGQDPGAATAGRQPIPTSTEPST